MHRISLVCLILAGMTLVSRSHRASAQTSVLHRRLLGVKPSETPILPPQETGQPLGHIPAAATGFPIPKDKGYYLECIKDGLWFLTDGFFQVMFMSTGKGVILVDCPPFLGEKIEKAIQCATQEKINTIIYSHHHFDHIGYCGKLKTVKNIIMHDAAYEELQTAFNKDKIKKPTKIIHGKHNVYKLGNQTLHLDYHGPVHSPGNLVVWAPRQKVLLLIDTISPGWLPFRGLSITVNVPVFVQTPSTLLGYDFNIYIGGHQGRYGSRNDILLSKAYMADLMAAAKKAALEVNILAIFFELKTANSYYATAEAARRRMKICKDEIDKKWAYRLAGQDSGYIGQNCLTMITALAID